MNIASKMKCTLQTRPMQQATKYQIPLQQQPWQLEQDKSLYSVGSVNSIPGEHWPKLKVRPEPPEVSFLFVFVFLFCVEVISKIWLIYIHVSKSPWLRENSIKLYLQCACVFRVFCRWYNEEISKLQHLSRKRLS